MKPISLTLKGFRGIRDGLGRDVIELDFERLAGDAAAATLKGGAIDSSWVFIGAALATGLSALGAGFAVAKVGTAAVGVEPEGIAALRPLAQSPSRGRVSRPG
mgnify:CR=1 FL=1